MEVCLLWVLFVVK